MRRRKNLLYVNGMFFISLLIISYAFLFASIINSLTPNLYEVVDNNQDILVPQDCETFIVGKINKEAFDKEFIMVLPKWDGLHDRILVQTFLINRCEQGTSKTIKFFPCRVYDGLLVLDGDKLNGFIRRYEDIYLIQSLNDGYCLVFKIKTNKEKDNGQ